MSNINEPLGPSPDGSHSGTSSFVGDLAISARALGQAPLMTILTVVLFWPWWRTGGQGWVFVLPVQIVAAGFVGTQRIWFARLYDGERLVGRDLWRITRSYIGRFIALGLIVFLPSSLLLLLVLRAFGSIHTVIAIDIAYGLALDLALTFVVPALAISTHSVRTACRIGFGMIGRTWPRCAWYVLTPGITLVVVAQALRPRPSSITTTTEIAVAAAILALWFKGAIVAFYLRESPSTPRD